MTSEKPFDIKRGVISFQRSFYNLSQIQDMREFIFRYLINCCAPEHLSVLI